MAERASPFAAPVAATADAARLVAMPRGSLWQIAAWPETIGDVEARLAAALDCEAPAPGRVGVVRQARFGTLAGASAKTLLLSGVEV